MDIPNSEKYKVYIDGENFQQEYFNLINSAQNKITLHAYIFKLDIFGSKVRELLIKKSKEGVAIEIFLDYLGSFELPNKAFENIQNINFKYFNVFSFPKLIRIGRRLHYKILIVDTQMAMVGGINVVDGIDIRYPQHPRLDFSVRVEGAIVTNLEKYCEIIFSQVENKAPQISDFDLRDFEGSKVFFKVNDWFRGRKQITSSYKDLIKQANKEIVFIHGYFFPSFAILKLLKKKANEGVSVIIVLPRYSDWTTWIWASEYLYTGLIKDNIKIYEWEISVLHGKMAIFDKKIITLGSHNLNYTSSYGNLEINIEIHDEIYSEEVRSQLVQYIIDSSKEITAQSQEKQKWTSKLRNFFFYSLLMSVAVFSVNYIKLSYQLAKMKPFQLALFILLILGGVLGLIVPVVPGVPFFIAAIFFYMKICKPQGIDLRP